MHLIHGKRNCYCGILFDYVFHWQIRSTFIFFGFVYTYTNVLMLLRYTLFYEHTLTGKPVMRPVWTEFPDDEGAFDEEREWLLGPSLLVRPVMDPDVQSVSLYLPGKRNIMWYGWNDHKV